MASFSVLSYNCEGLSPQKIEFIQDNVNQMKPSLICLQETWLLENNSFILSQISPQYQAFCVSGVDQQSKILSGRAYGGTAVLVDSGTIGSFKLVVSNSNRISAVECVADKAMKLVCSIYMPCDTQTSRVTETNIDTLNNLESLITENEYQDVLLVGDWNTDFTRNIAQIRELEHFMTRNDLKSIPHNDLFTYQSKDLRTRSLIDHVILY